MSRFVLGIDLGTTNTLCALWREGDPRPEVRGITQSTGEDLLDERPSLPSAVLFRPDGSVLVGEYPKYLARFGRPNVVTSIKRQMGTPWVRTEAGRSWTADRVSACILKAVRGGIGLKGDERPARVVITVPACFGTEQRRATLRAARLAGFDPALTDLFDEPTAALLHHTRAVLKDKAWRDPKTLMVLDVGGGTLDVSCMRLHNDRGVLTADVLGRSRFNELAGDDFDLNLAGLLLDRFEKAHKARLDGLPPDRQRQLCAGLLAAAERAKIGLCRQAAGVPEDRQGDLYEYVEVAAGGEVPWATRVTMKDLAVALKPFFVRESDPEAREQDFSFFTAIKECVRSAGDDLPGGVPDRVFLAGGSAGLPFLKQIVKKHFGGKVDAAEVDRPTEAVALGAAWYAGARAGFADAGAVRLEQRMHEGVYLLTRSGEPRELVAPGARLPVRPPGDGGERFETGPAERLEIDLVAGSGPGDPRMWPLDRRQVALDGFVTRGTPLRLSVSVDENYHCVVACVADVDGRPVKGGMRVHNGVDWQAESDLGEPLPAVNPAPEEGES